jgi:23S rRNA pseudouridine1911/1915/1917 synthase
MLSALEFHFRHRSTTGGNLSQVGDEFARPGVVHRLDRHTSGCIVFAKNDEAHWKIGHQFEHRQVDKRYMALVHGRIEPPMDVIDLPLGPHPSKEKGFREKVVVRHDDQGRNAITIYRVREVYDMRKAQPARAASPVLGWNPAAIEAPVVSRRKDPDVFTLVELELKTGRTHQIRVHLSHNDWPIVGDDMYGGRPYVDASGVTLIGRQALHATLLSFRHPVTEEKMTFTAPLRGDLAATVRSLRASSEHYVFTPPGATVNLAEVMKHIE